MGLGAYGQLGEWLLSGQLKLSKGTITLMGEYVGIIPVDFLYEMSKELIQTKEGRTKLYWWGWKSSYNFVRDFVKQYKLKTFEDRYRWTMDIVTTAGLGDYKTIDYHESEFTHFYVYNSPLAKKFIPSKKPVDYFLLGINAGGGSVAINNLAFCHELDCEAINKKRCEFLTATPKEYEKRKLWKKVSNDLDTKLLLKLKKQHIKKNKMPKF